MAPKTNQQISLFYARHVKTGATVEELSGYK